MDNKTKKTIFTGKELDKMKDFWRNYDEEDWKNHEQRQYNSDYVVQKSKQEYRQPKSNLIYECFINKINM